MDPPNIKRSEIINAFFKNPTKPLNLDKKILWPLSTKNLTRSREDIEDDQEVVSDSVQKYSKPDSYKEEIKDREAIDIDIGVDDDGVDDGVDDDDGVEGKGYDGDYGDDGGGEYDEN